MTRTRNGSATVLSRCEGYEDPGAIREALRDLSADLGWSAHGGPAFSGLVAEGARVTVKPNLVLHANQAPFGMTPLTTHAALIRVVVDELLDGGAASVLVADAPIQGCDFPALLRNTGLGEWAAGRQAADPRFRGITDLRRTVRSQLPDAVRARENVRPLEDFVLFDLGSKSLLEPVTDHKPRFRVTQYNPAYLARTHRKGVHQYLIAKPVLDCDLLLNLPKLKTHKKAGITCALKNLVGINGNKEYLPHHRLGGSETGGDCYPGGSLLKRSLEAVYDRFNSATGSARSFWLLMARLLQAGINRTGDRLGTEGSWSGNDTVWRMCLDLNRIALYGRLDGTLESRPARRLIHVADAIVAGQGEGPLAAEPLDLNYLLGSDSAATLDWVGAVLLGYDPARIPIVHHAFDRFDWPISEHPPASILARDAGGAILDMGALEERTPVGVHIPPGWVDALRPQPAAR